MKNVGNDVGKDVEEPGNFENFKQEDVNQTGRCAASKLL